MMAEESADNNRGLNERTGPSMAITQAFINLYLLPLPGALMAGIDQGSSWPTREFERNHGG